ncbi:hypothetical protein KZX37_10935 [Microbacterium sp. EYE_5]|nr:MULTISPECIES: hypothetical protein [unclassified Microbacterium]MCK6080972.1 hypothetical protein [Microbacterium sp. EYE_382]MCK6086242.1 hypothetical protein [Microbacterium sp. EYE_384]MCK6124260.1 hypothetical protein [Microbacterium sp. EYE_80]MCK6127169.1 hypothetical protein [Microbacterium sp. EYE_79]MCK6141927.1 hypothetical protein [Microbacterium sp. EYE_39]
MTAATGPEARPSLSDDTRLYIERLVAAAPPLSPGQRSRLAVLLNGGVS